MMRSREQRSFSDLFLQGTQNGIYKSKKLEGTGVKYLRMGDLFAHDRIGALIDGLQRMPLTPKELTRHQLEPGDLLFCRTSVAALGVGKCSIVVSVGEPIVAASNMILVRLNKEVADSRFYFSYFSSETGADNVRSQTRGAAVFTLTGGDIAGLDVPVPPLQEQHRIASILDALDDLIENNRRRIELLEEMAQAIYREWFVHFRFPGHEDATFVDSPLGPIPEGWEVGIIQDLCERIQAGGTPKRSEQAFWDCGTVDWYKTGELEDSILTNSVERITQHALTSSSARVFLSDTILMAIYGATIGQLGLLGTRSSANQAALGLVADPESSSTEYLWFTLLELRESFRSNAQGAAQQNTSKKLVSEAVTMRPQRSVVQEFTDVAGPAWRLSHELTLQVKKLEKIRDLLLPKLVTGEIDVSDLDLDALVEAAS
jgi:type I restriction enzyme S subunit